MGDRIELYRSAGLILVILGVVLPGLPVEITLFLLFFGGGLAMTAFHPEGIRYWIGVILIMYGGGQVLLYSYNSQVTPTSKKVQEEYIPPEEPEGFFPEHPEEPPVAHPNPNHQRGTRRM